MLEEVTADIENLGAVEITVSVGVLVTTNDDVAGNETVSLIHAYIYTKKLIITCYKYV